MRFDVDVVYTVVAVILITGFAVADHFCCADVLCVVWVCNCVMYIECAHHAMFRVFYVIKNRASRDMSMTRMPDVDVYRCVNLCNCVFVRVDWHLLVLLVCVLLGDVCLHVSTSYAIYTFVSTHV